MMPCLIVFKVVDSGVIRLTCVCVVVFASLLSLGAAHSMDLTFTTVDGGNGVPLSVVQTGNPESTDILFIHGFSQSYLSFQKQMKSDLAKDFHLTLFDLRGHGASGKPTDPTAYQSTQLWADDINAIIQERGLDKPVLVGWSWAGFIIMNYVRHYGVDDISGLNLVGANTSLQGPVPPPAPEPGQDMGWFGDMMSEDIATNLRGTTAFIDMVTAAPLPADVRHTNIIFNMMTPHYVRRAMMGYPQDNGDLADALTVPILITHGTKDPIIDHDGAMATLDAMPDGTASSYEGIGHAPFMEDAARFNSELAAFVRRVQ